MVEMGRRVIGDNGSRDDGSDRGVIFGFDIILKNRRVRFAILGVRAFVLSP